MLKRISEAISQSNIKIICLASETHCSLRSSCNFNTKTQNHLRGSLLGVFVTPWCGVGVMKGASY